MFPDTAGSDDDAPVHPVHDAVLGLGRAFLRSEDGAVGTAVAELSAALGAASMTIEVFDHDGVPTCFQVGLPTAEGEETGVSVAVGGTWAGSVTVALPGDPTPLDRWALEAVADLTEGWIRRRRASEELARTVEEKNRFVASVGHEIRTPLAAVLGLAGELRDRFDLLESDEARELIAVIADQSQEIADIVEDLLVFTRTERPGFEVRNQSTRLDDLVRAAVASVPAVVRTGLELRRIESVTASCDPLRTRQIVRNLVVNAHRHGGDRIFVDVTSLPEGDVVVTVADSGNPISEEIRATMFEPYAGSHRTDGSLASLGLGLTVSRQLARKMGGDLFYRWDGESRFEVHLPKSQAGSGVFGN